MDGSKSLNFWTSSKSWPIPSRVDCSRSRVLRAKDIKTFYEADALDTSDLLLVLEKAMGPFSEEVVVTTAKHDKKPEKTGKEAR